MLPKQKNGIVLLAGATGYLGRYIVEEMEKRKLFGRLIVRSPERLQYIESSRLQIVKVQVTDQQSLKGICKNVDTVISTVGITRQKDGLTYMDVDYQANLNLLREAQKGGVRKFIYVSVINGDKHRDLKITEAKEAFVDELRKSGLEYTVVRPNGFFSDMKDFLDMSQKGKVFLFGNGEQLMNPIHGADLAELCINLIDDPVKEISIGGPDVLTHNEIAEMAFEAHHRKVQILHLPNWLRTLTIWVLKKFTSVNTYGPIEFFLTLMKEDSVAQRYGNRRLRDFYIAEVTNAK
ncbi:SDR family oxidoreductase [uncultured Winogradskyella sp.]|uniref:SDR family oxidoreductase n=1 Tax=uncultured Winogradskyella sp. TaxID=395353 RepID=UPI00262CCD79|nr:SDR family oxidoreductase [uncultured Winogradskyella sp.]